MELIVASVVALVVVFGVVAVDSGRVQMHEELRVRSEVMSQHGQAALSAAMRLGKSLERADRINVLSTSPGNVRFRTFVPTADCGSGCTGGIPDPCCFDLPANYQWDQYRLTGTEMRLYSNLNAGCTLRVIARDITGLTFTFVDQAPQPPGGGPDLDNNLLGYTLVWTDGVRSHQFSGQVTSRAIAYSNLNTSTSDSGTGLAAPGVSNPPAMCP